MSSERRSAAADSSPPSPTIRRLLSLVRPYLPRLLLATAVTLVESGAALAVPRVAGFVVDTALLDRSLGQLDLVVLGLLALFAFRAVLGFVQLYLIRAAGVHLLRDLRDRVFAHLVALAPGFYDQRRVGELLSRIGSDLSRVQVTLTSQIPEGIRAATIFVGTLIILLVMSFELTLLAMLVVPPIVVLAMWYGRRLQRLAERIQDALAATSATAEESLAGVRTVQSFGREDHERGRYRTGLAELVTQQLRSARLVGIYFGALQFVGFSAFAIVLWFGGRLIVGGELTPGELMAFLLYAYSIATSMSSLGSLYAGLRELRGASARTFEILDTASPVPEPTAPITPPPAEGRLGFEGVHFSYPSTTDRRALRGIDLAVEPGEVVALVGPSGAGKSTLFSLLLRFYDPTAGRITVDGADVRDLELAELRRRLAVVPQEILLFSGTVAENIRYGRLDASDEQVRRAAVDAGADDFIRALPADYDELVGERGVRLSAGQRQRIAIARAFLREPRVLLLDEATSALDAESEAVVQEAAQRLMRGRTTLVIAHRLATARQADRIAVLEDGRVVDLGRHEELVERCELYRRYWALQARIAEDPRL